MAAPTVQVLVGHVLDHLRTLSDSSVQCVVTSPPYWGLRDYSRCGCMTTGLKQDEAGNPTAVGFNERWKSRENPNPTAFQAGWREGIKPQDRAKPEPNPDCPKCHGTGKDDSLTVVWDAKEGCEHEWGADLPSRKTGRGDSERRARIDMKARNPAYDYIRDDQPETESRTGAFCRLCNAWRGQLGLEPTPDLYVQHIVQVFREVRRVLRDDGTLWLNMGDCYASGSTRDGISREREDLPNPPSGWSQRDTITHQITAVNGLKPKDLVGMPWRVAFALQADGWWLRSDIIWAKPNPMPESVTDRPTKAHEFVFLLTKSARYFYDADAVRENFSDNRLGNPGTYKWSWGEGTGKGKGGSSLLKEDGKVHGWNQDGSHSGRNIRTVWTIPTAPYPEAHFATFPPALVEPCIKAGTSEKGCCATCGAPWERVVSRIGIINAGSSPRTEEYLAQGLRTHFTNAERESPIVKTLGFRPTCNHPGDPIPAVVLDPLAGSGTVGMVARSLGRSAILIEIKEEYAELLSERVRTNLRAIEEYP